ncbi:hypothetical protein JAAARDRAFT_675052 [Jaapia argillacea MUCL 33604]|uniref:Uncharacterized protein n=1 Tax=Jaapia argillacea MUCL 33604 TaxID=933084 RepID=A0A067PUX8_9AGAM|nr:hypothetical protein JAAARDRAFT_675052 [Jaapia argillacea MUCL 33604]
MNVAQQVPGNTQQAPGNAQRAPTNATQQVPLNVNKPQPARPPNGGAGMRGIGVVFGGGGMGEGSVSGGRYTTSPTRLGFATTATAGPTSSFANPASPTKSSFANPASPTKSAFANPTSPTKTSFGGPIAAYTTPTKPFASSQPNARPSYSSYSSYSSTSSRSSSPSKSRPSSPSKSISSSSSRPSSPTKTSWLPPARGSRRVLGMFGLRAVADGFTLFGTQITMPQHGLVAHAHHRPLFGSTYEGLRHK